MYSMVKNPRVEKNNLKGINLIPGILGAKSARVKAGSIGAKIQLYNQRVQ